MGDLEDTPEHLVRRYEGHVLQAGREAVTITREDLLRAAVKYGAAIADTMKMSRHLHAGVTGPMEIDVAVDETAYVTSFAEHYYMAAVLQRLGLDWVSFAPRYADGFEKRLEYVLRDGDSRPRKLLLSRNAQRRRRPCAGGVCAAASCDRSQRRAATRRLAGSRE